MSPFPFDLPDDPSRPVLRALSRACAENWDAFYDIVMKVGAQAASPPEERLSEPDALQMLQSAISYFERVKEITRWIAPPKPPLPIEEARQKTQQFRELGEDYVEELVSGLQKLRPGRPPARRQSHIAAFEYMLLAKKNSLGNAVRKFCPCGKHHGSECREQLRKGIHGLKKTLRNYAPDLVSRYDALHPDRAKKSRMAGKSAGFSPHRQ